MVDELRVAGNLNDSLSSAVRHGGAGLADIPPLLRRVLLEKSWRKFITQRGDEVEHQLFDDFVRTVPLRGLGSDPELVDGIVSGVKDPALRGELIELLREARKVGQGRRTDLELPADSAGSSDGSETVASKLARLSRAHPDQREAVRRGEKSVNRAAIDAGIRPKRVSIRVDSAESIAKTLRAHCSPEVLELLRRELL